MERLSDIFTNALNKVLGRNKNESEAYQDLDQGKKINVNMKSDRYTYGNQSNNNYNSDWTPSTAMDKETLSPEGYYRQSDRAAQKASIYDDIYKTAYEKAKAENPTKRKSTLDKMAKKEADDIFDSEYREKQISIPSTALSSIKYDPDTEGLEVTFTSSNKKYFYPGVPLEAVQALLKAPSKGEYFMRNIHDQYSMSRKDHSPKSIGEQRGIKRYMKAYYKNNKGRWSK